ncbi:hypothetical protein EMCRGX_G003971 [Ephydatia muelleri]
MPGKPASIATMLLKHNVF